MDDIIQAKIDSLKTNLESILYSDFHIHAGTDRKVELKKWEKNSEKRIYLNIRCYSAMGHFKGQYKCGYLDLNTGDYIVGKYDDVNAETKEYIGR